LISAAVAEVANIAIATATIAAARFIETSPIVLGCFDKLTVSWPGLSRPSTSFALS
jgi:hypothetical protein